MEHLVIKNLRDNPEFLETAALWFNQKWRIPVETYKESIQLSINKTQGVPQWYMVLDENHKIIAGAGVIENDFHTRTDLSPNLCALYVDVLHRKKGIAKDILNFARKDMGSMGFKHLYLITDHKEFYEACGWDFLTMVTGDDGKLNRMYVASTEQS